MSIPILLATSNEAKLARLRWLLEELPFTPRTPAELPPGTEPIVAEDGSDFATNTAQKAAEWSVCVPGMLTLASDGGMEIPALGSRWTALRTRRNAGPDATDRARIEYLLGLMRDLHGEDRRAYWHEAVALARDGAVLQVWTASGDGGLIVEQVLPGTRVDGFWTESVRYYPAAGKLYRDLTTGEAEAVATVWPLLRAAIRDWLRVTFGNDMKNPADQRRR